MTIPEDLNPKLLNGIMKRMGELRARYPELTDLNDLFDLVNDIFQSDGGEQAYFYLGRHVTYLINDGYLTEIGGATLGGNRIIRLTNFGERFVQPELADFGQPMLKTIVKTYEDQIDILTYPEEDKESLKLNLREAIAKKVPELFVTFLAEFAAHSAMR